MIKKRLASLSRPAIFLLYIPLFFGLIPMEAGAAPPLPRGDLVQLTVAKGDYLVNLCQQYLDKEGRWKEIGRINRLKNPHLIQPGQKIMIPAAYLKGTPINGRVALAQGEAKAQRDEGGPWTALKEGDLVPPRSRLKTGKESALEVVYDNGTSLLLRSETVVGVLQARKASTSHLLHDFFLEAGRTVSKVREATGEASRYKVHTPAAIASVRGTEFRVAVDAAQKTFTEVMERRVAVDAASKRVELEQGEGTVVHKGKPPLPPQRLLPPPRPVDLQAIYNCAPVIAFSRLDEAAAYRAILARDPQGRALVQEKIIETQGVFRVVPPPDGNYYLLVQSIDALGLEGVPSKPYPLAIRLNPLPPITQSPREGAKIKGTEATFTWLTVDDAAGYNLQIGEDVDFTKVAREEAGWRETSFKAGGLDCRTCYFRIRSVARDGYQGAWSDPLPFTLAPLPPTPSVAPPTLAKDEISLRAAGAGAGFTYHFQIAKDDRFQEIMVDQMTPAPELTVKRPKDAGIYYVRTAAVDEEGDAGAFSPPQRFEIEAPCPYAWLGSGIGTLMLIVLLLH